MATLILVEGVPGSGKSTSIRTLDPKSTYIILPNAKSLPFKGAKAKYKQTTEGVNGNLKRTDDFNLVPLILKKISASSPEIKTVVIDD